MVLVTVLCVGCTPTSPGPSKITWRDCGGGFQCGTLQVPLDYSNRYGRKIALALIRKPAASRTDRIGSVLFNPGGPGGSGIDFLRGTVDMLRNLNHRFDLVSWDPRGVGASTPVTCADGPQLDAYLALDSVLDDPDEKQTYIQATQDFAAGCQRRSGDLLPFMDTASTAWDLDEIRAAVGDPKLTYLGFSYGTYIGLWYAHLFPKRVRALALDAVFDATDSQGELHQLEGFESNLMAFIADCRSNVRCAYGRNGDPQQKLDAAIARLDATPLRVGGRLLTRSLALRGVLGALYDQEDWPYLDQALTALEAGDGRDLLALADYFDGRNADGSYGSLVNGAFDATVCLDSPSFTTDIAFYDQLGPYLTKASPHFGQLDQYGGLLCAYWPVKPKHFWVPLPVLGAPPILFVGGTNDPATPYAAAESVTKQVPGSVLLTRKGNGHTSYGSSLCAHAAEDAYLIDLTLPAPGTVCSG